MCLTPGSRKRCFCTAFSAAGGRLSGWQFKPSFTHVTLKAIAFTSYQIYMGQRYTTEEDARKRPYNEVSSEATKLYSFWICSRKVGDNNLFFVH
jgi:hypothetical protein